MLTPQPSKGVGGDLVVEDPMEMFIAQAMLYIGLFDEDEDAAWLEAVALHRILKLRKDIGNFGRQVIKQWLSARKMERRAEAFSQQPRTLEGDRQH